MKLPHPPMALVIAAFFSVMSSIAWAQNPVPFVNQPLVPTAVAPGGAAFTLTVNGTGFVPGATVNWNGSPRPTTLVSGTQLTAEIPDTDIATPRTGWVTVVNPTPGGGTSNVAYLQVAVAGSYVPLSSSVLDIGASQFPHVLPYGSDFNGDGKLDLLLSMGSSTGSALFVLLGNGDGTFAQPLDVSPAGSYLYGVAVADFNGDRTVDLACAYYNGYIYILLGKGDGTFQPPILYDTAMGVVMGMAVGDFNEDGKLDIAGVGVPFFHSDSVWVLLGNGDGTFLSPAFQSLSPCPAVGLTLGDFDKDNSLDIAVNCDSSLLIYLGRGDGTFQSTGSVSDDYWGGMGAVAADFNGDAVPDLAVADSHWTTSEARLSTFPGNGDGTFQAPVRFNLASSTYGYYQHSVSVGDFNADGRLDVAVAGQDMSILLGDGDGGFQPPFQYPISFESQRAVVSGDLNGDGRPDLVAYSGFTTKILYVILQKPVVQVSPVSLTFQGQAAGTSSAPQSVTLSNYTFSPLTIPSIDHNGDYDVTHNCPTSPSTLAAPADCALNITFNPTAAGVRNGDVTITHDGPASPIVIALTGTGIAPTADLSPAGITFDNQYVGTSGLPETVTVMNNGSIPLTISAVTTSSSEFGVLNTCTSSVDPGVSCNIGVFFRPTQGGSRAGELVITDNAPGSPHTVTLTGAGMDFTITVSGGSSTSKTISSGQTATYALNLEPMSGFTGALTLACSGAPPLGTCAVLPTSVTLNGTSAQTVTVSVATTAPSMSAPRGKLLPPGFDTSTRRSPLLLALWLLMLAAVAAFIAFSGTPALRRQALRFVPALALAAMLAGLTLWPACGGGGGTTVIHNPGTPAGTYTLTVGGTMTTTSGSLSRSLSLTLNVN